MSVKWVKCGAMPNPKYRVLRPISLRLSKYDDGWIAESYWLNDWGWGQSQSEAMLDFMRALPGQYEVLSSNDIAPYLTVILKRIKTYIEPRNK